MIDPRPAQDLPTLASSQVGEMNQAIFQQNTQIGLNSAPMIQGATPQVLSSEKTTHVMTN